MENFKVFDLLRSSRKLLHCLLKQSKPEAARDAALAMTPDVKRHPLSLYLTYCIAIQFDDDDLGRLNTADGITDTDLNSAERVDASKLQWSPPCLCLRDSTVRA